MDIEGESKEGLDEMSWGELEAKMRVWIEHFNVGVRIHELFSFFIIIFLILFGKIGKTFTFTLIFICSHILSHDSFIFNFFIVYGRVSANALEIKCQKSKDKMDQK